MTNLGWCQRVMATFSALARITREPHCRLYWYRRLRASSGVHPYGSFLTPSGTTLFRYDSDGGGNWLTADMAISSALVLTARVTRDVVSLTGTSGGANGEHIKRQRCILSDTTLYGMTAQGGANGYGNVFSVGTGGTNYKNVVSLTGTGGAAIGGYPHGSLILSGTTLYGLTSGGGPNGFGYGNIFDVGIDGSNYSNILSFTGTGGGGKGAGIQKAV